MLSQKATFIAGTPNYNLGEIESFAVLAETKITNVGISTISGSFGSDIGLSLGNSIDEGIILTDGEVHIHDSQTDLAKIDFTSAYDKFANNTSSTVIDSELGGKTLYPGIYTSESGTFEINGVLTLDAKDDSGGVFIFQTKSTLITASGSSVITINSANSTGIFWQVGTSANLGANSTFIGNLFTMITINVKEGAVITGQLFARLGSVNLNNNIIINEASVKEDAITSESMTAQQRPWYDYIIFGFCIFLLCFLVLFIYKKAKPYK